MQRPLVAVDAPCLLGCRLDGSQHILISRSGLAADVLYVLDRQPEYSRCVPRWQRLAACSGRSYVARRWLEEPEQLA